MFSRIYKSDKIASINAMLCIFFKSIAGLHPWTKNAHQFPNSGRQWEIKMEWDGEILLWLIWGFYNKHLGNIPVHIWPASSILFLENKNPNYVMADIEYLILKYGFEP